MSTARWQSVQLPYFFERMIGFSLPVEGEIAVISYEVSRGGRGEALELDLKGQRLRIFGPARSLDYEHRFEDLSGDWGFATFTPDFEHVVLGLPNQLEILRRR